MTTRRYSPAPARGAGGESIALRVQTIQRALKLVGVRTLGFCQRFKPVGDFIKAFVARGFGHARIHVGMFVCLTGNGGSPCKVEMHSVTPSPGFRVGRSRQHLPRLEPTLIESHLSCLLYFSTASIANRNCHKSGIFLLCALRSRQITIQQSTTHRVDGFVPREARTPDQTDAAGRGWIVERSDF